jgi:predicted porin
VFARWGTGINYYPAAGLEPFLASQQEIEAGVTIRPTPQLRLEETYLFTRLSSRDDTVLATATPRGDIFNNHILRSRVDYQFTRRLSARVIFDYDAVLPNESLVSLERTKRFAADVLVTYLVNPWTALYVGYTDAYANLEEAPGSSPPWVRGGDPTTSIGRQVFVKVSYLFRY